MLNLLQFANMGQSCIAGSRTFVHEGKFSLAYLLESQLCVSTIKIFIALTPWVNSDSYGQLAIQKT